jgi:hypothetical protein
MCRLSRTLRNKTREGVRRGGVRRERKKRGRGMKDREDTSMGIVTLIVKILGGVKETKLIRFF